MFTKILIANRGEIAVRIIRACREMGIASVAVYSEADRRALHVRLADEAVLIGPAAAGQSYLSIDRILTAARQTGAQAIHPGYGFLSENAAFARAVQQAGLVFIGPPPEAIEAMGDKGRGRDRMQASGVPVVPGYQGPDDDQTLVKKAEEIGYPLLVKATAGGGGRGMRVVHAASDLVESIAAARREALHAFGNQRMILERYIPHARHIEFQILADNYGRSCTCANGNVQCSAAIKKSSRKHLRRSWIPTCGSGWERPRWLQPRPWVIRMRARLSSSSMQIAESFIFWR